MFVMHIALQGCLKARDVPYGLTADTGGHIKYLLELVEAASRAGVTRQELVVRRFHDDVLGHEYAEPFEGMDVEGGTARIVRIEGATPGYLPKERLGPELPALTANLIEHILSLPSWPDVVHAHYADAGHVAAEVKRRLGIPFVFTAHSLGRVKLGSMPQLDGCPRLAARIEAEERAMREADALIVSSRDEAVAQYGLYADGRRATPRIRINPPGCDLDAFGSDAPRDDALERDVSRGLDRPDLPPVLALARPVAKKNLAGLVRAFGASDLRERANLVVVAGTRTDLREEEREHRAVLEELLYLADLHDLAGSFSMPKRHAPHQVPALYAYARARCGVFVNMALNEPFGLTFLEAAASGVPVVATCHGGPRDIVGRLGNGALVEPLDETAIARAIAVLVDEPARWNEAASNGLARIGHYGWTRHARDYVRELSLLAKGHAPHIRLPRSAASATASPSASTAPVGPHPLPSPSGLPS